MLLARGGHMASFSSSKHRCLLIPVTADSTFSPTPGDVLLLTPPGAETSLVQFRFTGGILDLYFFSGPSPTSVVEQYGQLLGFPVWTPTWAFGFHLCRYAVTYL